MNPVQASMLALAMAFAGMVALAFAMERHHEQLMGTFAVPPARRRLLRGAGALLLATAMLPCVWVWGATVGTVAWLGWLSAGALGAVAWIAVAPRGAAGAACVACLALPWGAVLRWI